MLMDSTAQVLRGFPYDGARDSLELIQGGASLRNGDVVTLMPDGTVNKVGATPVAPAGLVFRGNLDSASATNSIGRYPTPQPAQTMTAIAWSGGVVTVTIAGHGYTTGQTVTIAGVTPAGYNGTYVITVTSTSTFTYALATNPGTETALGTSTLQSAFDPNGTAVVLWGNYIVRTQNYAAGNWVPGAAVTASNGQFALQTGTQPIIGYCRRVQAASSTQTAAVDIEVL